MMLKKCFVLIVLCLLCPAVFGQTDFLGNDLPIGKENELAPSATLTVTKTADTSDGVCNSDCSLREAIASANAAATDDIINFDATVFAGAQTITLTLGELTIANNGALTINGTGANLLTISGNNASRVLNISSGANATISGVRITGGNSSLSGGGINNFGTLNLTSSTVSGNSAPNGGGIVNIATLNVANSTVSDNSATFGGAGIFNGGGATANITNSTVSGNTIGSTGSGGGINSSGPLNVTNSTITGNSANFAGGVANAGGGIFRARNTVLSGNTANTDPDLRGTIAVNENNLIGGNALLAPLGNYGGATRTQALLAGSSAINAGNNCVLTQTCATFNAPVALNTDQRGRPRVGQVDIGAFEVPATIVVTKTADTNGVCNSGVNCSLREAVAAANSTVADENIQFLIPASDPGCGNGVCTITLTNGEMAINAAASAGNFMIQTTNATSGNLLVSGNNASRIFNVADGANLILNDFSIVNGSVPNSGIDGGGGMIQYGGALTMVDMTVRNNRAPSRPGGGLSFLALNGSSSLTIVNSTFSGNSAINSGGGIIATAISITAMIVNSTFSGNNSSSGNGGGFSLSGGGPSNRLTVVNSTFTGNSAGNRGGGIGLESGTISLRNTIIGGNFATLNTDLVKATSTVVTSEGNNLVTASADTFSPIAWRTAVGTADILNQSPQLAPLAYYGGKTMTSPPLSTSAAVNAGNSCVTTLTCGINPPALLSTDQRGAARVGNVDIGAFEVNSSANGGTFRATLPTGRVGTPYNFALVPNNGTTSYAVTGGALPPGMNLTTAFAPSAVVSLTGTPTAGGVFNFTITATNGANTSVTDYSLNVFVPTAAGVSVSGRVLTSDGRGVTNAFVVITDSSGNVRSVRTGTFGYFRFDSVAAGQTYIVSVNSKRFIFPPQVVEISDELTNLNFIADGRD